MQSDTQGTWIKLYRKILDNEIFVHDRTAWHAFEVLLIIADKKDGSWAGGLFQLADLSNINKNTLYKALKRLELAGMIKRSVNSKYTVFHICNWHDYQGNGQTESKRSVNAGENSNKIEELRNNNNKVELQMQHDIVEIYDFYIEQFEKNANKYKLTKQRKAKIKSRLKDAGSEMLRDAIRNTANSPFHRGDNDRGWEANLDWIIRSYEQVEKQSEFVPKLREEDALKKVAAQHGLTIED